MKSLEELENAILDQIEKLNDDSIAEDKEKSQIMINRSKAMSDLTERFIEINRLKFDIAIQSLSFNKKQLKYLGLNDESAK